MSEPQFSCDICGHHFTRDEISFMEDNELDLDLCDSCLEGQREIDVQEEREVDLGWIQNEIKEIQKLERRQI